MNKQKYLAELAGLLSFLSEEDRVTVMDYYTKKFDAAGENGESALIDELGTPMLLAISLNRMGIDAIIAGDEAEKKAEEAPEAEETPEAEEATEEETAGPEETPAEEFSAETEVTDEEAPEATEAEEAQEEEKLDAAELIRAIMEEPGEDAEPESEESGDEDEESALEVTAEVETLEVSAEPQAEEAPEAEAGIAENYHESFPELSVAQGKKLPEPENKPATKLSVAGAIAFWLLMIVPGLPLLVLSVAVAPLLLAVPAALGWAGAVALRAGLSTLMYVPDAMFLFGIAMLAIGAALLLLLLALRVIAAIVSAWKNGVSGLWNRLARKEC